MSKAEELIAEIDGKISYADVTGNMEAKSELADIRALIVNYASRRKQSQDMLKEG